MVTQAYLWATILFAAWDQLTPLDRARLQLALLALVILLLGVIGFVLLMGRWARRQVAKPLPPVRHGGDRWINREPVAVKPAANLDTRLSNDPPDDEQ